MQNDLLEVDKHIRISSKIECKLLKSFAMLGEIPFIMAD